MNTPLSTLFRVRIRLYLAGLAGIALFILLNACTTGKAHIWSDLPKDRVAVIKPDQEKAFTEVHIVSVDDEDVGFFNSAVEVTPGHHTIFVVVLMDCPYLNNNLYLFQHLSFETEIGRAYTVHGKIDTLYNEGYVWVTSDNPPGRYVVGFKQLPL